MTNDESTLSNVSGGNVADRSSRTCLLLEAYKVVPTDARYVSVHIKGTTIPVKNADEVLIWICKKMSVLQASQLQRLMRVRKLGWLKATPGGMEKRYRIAYNCFVNLDGSGTAPLLRAAKLLEWLAWPRNDVSLTYALPRPFVIQTHDEIVQSHDETEIEEDDSTNEENLFSNVAMAEVNVVTRRHSDQKRDADDLDARVKKLLATRFLNGVRPGSCIDQNKIRRAYREMFNADMPADFDFEKTLPKLGLVNEGKVFPLPNSDGAAWRKVIEGLIERGFGLFSYARVMELHAPEMIAAGVSSDEMLKKLLRESAADEFQIGEKYFACLDWPLKVPDAVVRMIPEGVLTVSERQLCRLLPYVDPADIHFLLASDGRFVWNSPDCFVHAERVEFDGQELKCALARVRKEVDEQGYFSLAQLEFNESASLNDSSLMTSACRKVFYNRYLMHDYAIHGQIVCHPGDEIDGRVPLREFCRARSDVTLEQVGAVAKEYNIALDAAIGTVHEVMVRVDGDRFVTPEMVPFDVAVIDSELERYCVSAVTTLGVLDNLSDLSAIPGYNWNRFLLESFLRRASRRFMLMKPSASERDVAGVVVRRDSGIVKIAEALAMAAMASGVAADAHEVGEFLVATRCTQRRGATLIAQVVSRLRDLYERRK